MAEILPAGYRLSPQQRLLWRAAAASGAPLGRAEAAFSIEGDLDTRGLRAALGEVVRRHEILRTAFVTLPGMTIPLQSVQREARLGWEEMDWSLLPDEEREQRLDLWFAAARAADAAGLNGPPCRAAVALCAEGRHLLLLSAPLLCADVLGLANVALECCRLHGSQDSPGAPGFQSASATDVAGASEAASAAGPSGQPAVSEPVQYVQISEWLHELATEEAAAEGRRYWRERDSAEMAAIPLFGEPARRDGRDCRDVGGRSAMPLRDLGGRRQAEMRALAAAWGCEVAVIFSACWHLLLSRFSGRGELCVATLMDGRTDDELRATPGPLARHVPLRSQAVPEASFRDYVAAHDAEWRAAALWQDCYPPQGDEEAPWFAAAFEYQPPAARWRDAGLAVRPLRRRAECQGCGIQLTLEAGEETLAARFVYDAGRWQAAAVERLAEGFAELLDSVARTPQAPCAALRVLGAAERRTLLERFNDASAALAVERGVGELFEERVRLGPDAVAVIAPDGEVTFRDLNRRANQLARHLARAGVAAESRVGLCLERSVEMVVAMLAVLKAGGVYVPLDPEHPAARLAALARDAGLAALITRGGLWPDEADESTPAVSAAAAAARLPVVLLERAADEIAALGGGDLGRPIDLAQLAYVLYTSGSTGTPKGVMISHRALANHMLWMARELPLTAADKVLQKTAFTFDAAVWELFAPLLAGARLVLAPPDAHRDPAAVVELVRRHEITVLQVVPTFLHAMLETSGLPRCASLRRVFCGGERLAKELRDAFFRQSGAALYNLYGPTEATIDATWAACERDAGGAAVPIGRPIANLRAHVLDPGLEPVPIGVAGELYLGGHGLARGYGGRADLTAERFLPDPFAAAGERLYRTGDLARYRPDGSLECLGRLDRQLKLRGFRVEPGEVEAALRGHPAVEQAVVAPPAAGQEGAGLAAYVVPDARQASTVRRALRLRRQELPDGAALHELPNGMTVVSHNRREADFLYEEIFARRSYLRHGVELRDGDCVFDVGANVGFFSLFAASQRRGLRILACEPIPPVCAILRLNATLADAEIRVFDCGIGGRAGSDEFTYYPHLSLMSSRYADERLDRDIVRRFESNQAAAGAPAAGPGSAAESALLDELLEERMVGRRFACELKTVSQLMRENQIDTVDLLKIDAERSELEILAGIDEEDWGKIRQLVLEVEDGAGGLGKVVALLRARGFRVTVEQEHQLRETSLHDVYAVREERPPEAGAASGPRRWLSAAELIAELRRHSRQLLPDYLVPADFVLLDALPVLPSGKVDFAALPAPRNEPAARERAYVEPRTEAERLICDVWGAVLGVERVGLHEDFFALGGHSLLATQAVARLRESFRVELPLRSLFAHPTAARLAPVIAELARARIEASPAIGARGGGGEVEVLAASVDELSDQEVDELLRELQAP